MKQKKGSKKEIKIKKQLISFPHKGGYRSFPVNKIVFCEAKNHSITIHLKDKSVFSTRTTLSRLTNVFPVNFYRCHNSFIINLKHIEEHQKFSKNTVLFFGKQIIPIAKRRKVEFEKKAYDFLFL